MPIDERATWVTAIGGPRPDVLDSLRMTRLFHAAGHQEHFEQTGWVLAEQLGAGALEETEAVFRAGVDVGHAGFHSTLELDDFGEKARVSAFLAERFRAALEGVVLDHRAIACNFVSKGSDTGSVVPPHQDWSFVDERTHRSLNVWIPLCATNAENGALGLVSGSHRLRDTIRGTGVPVSVRMSGEAVVPYLSVVPMQAGDALIYDHRMIHASAANRSGRPRTAVSISLIPDGAPALHYVGGAPGAVLELEVDGAFFDRYRLGQPVDTAAYPSREVVYEPAVVDAAALDPLRPRRARRRRPWARK